MKELQARLAEDLAAESPPAGIELLADEIRRRHGDAVRGIVFYGSCRRRRSAEGLADLLVLVDSYGRAHAGRMTRLLNAALPPNVYYLQVTDAGVTYRCKYALVSLDGFARRCRSGLDAYFRARFAQPCRLVWSADPAARERIVRARADAVRTLAREAAPLLRGVRPPDHLWTRGLTASYRCELRPERPAAVVALVHADADYYRAVTNAVACDLPDVSRRDDGRLSFAAPPARRLRARALWALRRPWSKSLNVLRLLKAAGTFRGGVDYVVWKVERHSGVRIEATERMRRYPRLSAFALAWRLWRRKALQQ